ncbi:MAG TPA: thiamine pyrophosphate-dependent enzyme [Saprospiraceae bacterium]|nr:thiamine pyrophosphate-dependent enzyme [Saprospiraceae bacterium]HMQ83046.1 thiamine pyrophosphate-dependent enzyme [Saprospiraceae bacterium]
MQKNQHLKASSSLEALSLSKTAILEDFEICCISREASILARKEVLTGKAKFGIVGDGKEVPQVAMARVFQPGDWRSGYYRDQTFMLAKGLMKVEDFFAQLYADPANDPFSGGRQMNSHFANPTIDTAGNWLDHTRQYNVSSDISSTAGQMSRGLGLALASKKYRELEGMPHTSLFSKNGDEVCFCTIGDASTSEGVFWETINAAGVMQVPLAVFVWDDGYGISVPKKYQTTKNSISEVLAGFEKEDHTNGILLYKGTAGDYPGLLQLFTEVIEQVRTHHYPAVFHIDEVTQPLGHSTSGSHERYKDKKRLEWEKEKDCIRLMEVWMLQEGIASHEEIESIKKSAKKHVKEARDRAWKAFNDPTHHKIQELKHIYHKLEIQDPEFQRLQNELLHLSHPLISEVMQNAQRAYFHLKLALKHTAKPLEEWITSTKQLTHQHYHTHLHSNSQNAALNIPVVPPSYSASSSIVNGFQVLNAFFSKVFERDLAVIAFGEDVGRIGDVNQGFAGLQEKFGEKRIFDTGIREWTIMGQAIGMAMRGLRPIAEIQYLDYLIYGLEPLSDDLATLRYRSNNQQKAPAIIRTRGHRLEGIWHAGSPLGMLIHALRGMHVLVPRNMVQAAGMYHTLLQSDEPGLVIECLNGYRLKEKMPDNIGEYTVPLGVAEVLIHGRDITLVTYGSCVRIAQEGIQLLKQYGISVELIDVQSLLPFDLEQTILQSIQKTNRVLFMDEDVPGGATAYMMQQVLENQGAYQYLDSSPVTLCAKSHRPPYGSDGDYFSKPNAEDVVATVLHIIKEAEPYRF